MRTFLGTHWKAIAALIVLVLLALLAVPTGSASPALATRLQARAEALAHQASGQEGVGSAARYIGATLAEQGYRVQLQRDGPGRLAVHTIEAWRSAVLPGRQPLRSFIFMASLRSDDDLPATAAMLEVARLLQAVRPTANTELRFVFMVSRTPPRDAPSGNLVAYVGPRASLAQVGASIAFFLSAPDGPGGAIAAPGWVQGVTLGGLEGPGANDGAMLLADIDALQSPCLPASRAGGQPQFETIARMVRQLARSVRTLAGTNQS
jgi:hypothetical protein